MTLDILEKEYYSTKATAEEKICARIGVFFFFVIINSWICWNSLELVIRAVAAIGMVYATMLLTSIKKAGISSFNQWFFISTLVYSCYLLITLSLNVNGFILRVTGLAPAILFVLWHPSCLRLTYIYCFKILIIVCLGSILISVLQMAGLLHFIPYVELPPVSSLHERMGYVYHWYFGINTIFDRTYPDLLPRACGVLQEPGHFAIIIGFFYVIERLQNHKVNWIIVAAGLLTFSSVFIMMALLVEMIRGIIAGKALLVIMYIVFFIILLIGIFFVLPSGVQEDIVYQLFQRNFEKVYNIFVSSNSMNLALDNRTSQNAQIAWNHFVRYGNVWFGDTIDMSKMTLSDYRGMLLQIGFVGLFVVLIEMTASVNGLPLYARATLWICMFIVLLHRSWMMYVPYCYLICFMGTQMIRNYLENSKNTTKIC